MGTPQAQSIASKYPADISFLVADLKYSKEGGVKLCEVQHGILSTFFGDKFIEGNGGVIPAKFLSVLSQYQSRAWAVGKISDPDIVKGIHNSAQWRVKRELQQLITDSEFIERANLPVYDPCDLYQYHGLVFIRSKKNLNPELLQQRYPGVLIMDMPTRAYWIDKYKMSELFNRNATLSKYKPKWGLYPKEYSEDLAKTIIDELGGDLFVIKPRAAFLGNGVIIVSGQDLDSTLRYILSDRKELQKDPDKSYHYWCKDTSDSFIVEEFIHSDLLSIEHLDGKIYEPTMRMAVALTYHQNQIGAEFLGAYWLLPCSSLEEGSTLNEMYKAYCKPPYFAKPDPQTLSLVKEQVLEALQLLYKEMLISDYTERN